MAALQQGVVCVGVVSALWGQVLMDAAREVFGCSKGRSVAQWPTKEVVVSGVQTGACCSAGCP